MELNLLTIFILLIIAIFLIFKLIKKVVFAIISAILLVLILFGGVIGLAVYDVKTLSEQNQFDINLIYQNGDDYIFGSQIPFNNGTFEMEKFKSISESEFKELDLDGIEIEDNLFVVTIQKETMKKFLDNPTYTFDELSPEDLPDDTNIELTNEQLHSIVESSNPENDFINLMLEKNNIGESVAEFIKPALQVAIKEELDKYSLTLNQALILMAMEQEVESADFEPFTLIEEYKDKQIQIYPDRFTFYLIRQLPAGFIKGLIDDKAETITE